ncbi:MAG TPA: hypothetical protein VIN73_03750 [Vicingaceae bacterium]
MIEENELKEKWENVLKMVEDRFGEQIDEQTILYIIGLQELNKPHTVFQKEEKVDIIHIGICTVLSQFGYYRFTGRDEDGWPHFKNIKKIPSNAKGRKQLLLMRKAIIDYFENLKKL